MTPETEEHSVLKDIDKTGLRQSAFPGSWISWDEQRHGRVITADGYEVSEDTTVVFSTLSGHRYKIR